MGVFCCPKLILNIYHIYLKGDFKMAQVYVNLVKRGLKTIEQVPERIRAEVEALLAEK